MKTLILTDEEIEQIKISIVHRGIKSGSNKLNLIFSVIPTLFFFMALILS